MFPPDPALLSALRGLHLLMLLALGGAVAFRVVVAPPALAMVPGEAPALLRGLHRWARGCAILALASGVAWFVVEAGAIAAVGGLGDMPAALRDVALSTRFGHMMMVRAGLLLACGGLIGRSDGIAALLALAATALQGWLGHAGAAPRAEGVSLLVSEALHLVAAGAWLGSLPLLWRWLRAPPLPAVACLCRRFSPLGMVAVLVLAGTGLLQSLALVATGPGLVGTDYGRAVLAKVALFGVMIGLALYNRLALTERLSCSGDDARTRLRRSVLVEIGLGMLIVGVAALLASLTPAVHEPPLWPFAWQPSFELMSDNEFRQEVVTASLLVGLAAMAVVASLFLRRGRIIALAVLVLVLVTRGSSFGLLLAPAYPTSFFTSPTDFAVSGIVEGQVQYGKLCAGCHGVSGRGDGPAAAGLPVRPAALTAAHLLEHPDGELFWWLSEGIEDPDHGRVMPAFARDLTDAQRWDMIDYLRARNAGIWLAAHGTWPRPMPAPAVPINCRDIGATRMQDLRGSVVQVIADGAGGPALRALPAPDDPPVVRLHLSPPGANDCRAATPDAWDAYAVLAGRSPQSLAGAVFLVDANGWLRNAYLPREGSFGSDPDQLTRDVQQVRANPLPIAAGGGHEHHHEH